MREAVRGCLDRLMSQNYIGRTGDTYNFLTDEEQDIQREIRDTNVDTASIVERIAQMLSLIHIYIFFDDGSADHHKEKCCERRQSGKNVLDRVVYEISF